MSKVQFLGDKGEVFFECHPAEVRVAIDAVKNYRRLGYAITPEEKASFANFQKVVAATPQVNIGNQKTCVDFLISQMFHEVEKKDLMVTHLIVNPRVYATMRTVMRDQMSIETRTELLKLGKMAEMWAAHIYICSALGERELIAANCEGNMYAVKATHEEGGESEAFDEKMKELIDIAHRIKLLAGFKNRKKV